MISDEQQNPSRKSFKIHSESKKSERKLKKTKPHLRKELKNGLKSAMIRDEQQNLQNRLQIEEIKEKIEENETPTEKWVEEQLQNPLQIEEIKEKIEENETPSKKWVEEQVDGLHPPWKWKDS
ncbi:hypothetical protein SDJN03_19029, partial [Cucurbita argyrosperma subsp. sororia]